MTTWIKTSDELPITGKKVLVCFRNELNNPRRTCAFYAAELAIMPALGEYVDCDYLDYDEQNDVFCLPPGWYEENEFAELNWKVDADVTHWMELPNFTEESQP